MASSSSDESCKAPENFQVSDDDDDDDDDDLEAIDDCFDYRGKKDNYKSSNVLDTTTVAFIKCRFCQKAQQNFHCRDCVRNGYITRKGQPFGESLSSKQQRYFSLQNDLKAFSQRYDTYIKGKILSENIKYEIKRYQQRVEIQTKLINIKKLRLQRLNDELRELARANSDKRKTLPRYPIKVKELEDYVLDRLENICELRQHHRFLLNELKMIARHCIQQLVEYIFPINEIIFKEEHRQLTTETDQPSSTVAITNTKCTNIAVEEYETIAALADAKNTSYIRGKWVFHGSGISEMQYSIASASLPANGDYSAYFDWLKENKDDVPKTTASDLSPSKVSAFRIVGALTYTTQLTQLISYYLNVRLPYKLFYGDFCKKLNEDQFTRKVAHLNSNIMYLAYTQQVKLRTLNENHTLENLLTLLDTEKSNLGHHGHHEVVNAPLKRSVDSLLVGIETATETESDDESSLRLDWEAVPNVVAATEEAGSAATITPTTLGGQRSNIAEGLVTSAASRFNSFLRWIK